MDNKVLCDQLIKVEKKLAQMLTEVHEVNQHIQEMTAKNTFLTLENERLKESLSDEDVLNETLENTSGAKNELAKSAAKNCLESLYNDGFHVCNAFYGSRCLNNEECLLCLEMLDR